MSPIFNQQCPITCLDWPLNVLKGFLGDLRPPHLQCFSLILLRLDLEVLREYWFFSLPSSIHRSQTRPSIKDAVQSFAFSPRNLLKKPQKQGLWNLWAFYWLIHKFISRVLDFHALPVPCHSSTVRTVVSSSISLYCGVTSGDSSPWIPSHLIG